MLKNPAVDAHSAVHHAVIAFLGSCSKMYPSCWLGMICCWGRQLTSLWNTCVCGRWVDTRTVAHTPPPPPPARASSEAPGNLPLSICHTVMNWTLLVFGIVSLLVLGEDAFVQGKRDARSVTFSRTARGHSRRRRDTWTGQTRFTACKTPLSPKDQEILLSHTHEVRTRHWRSQSKCSIFFLCCFFTFDIESKKWPNLPEFILGYIYGDKVYSRVKIISVHIY